MTVLKNIPEGFLPVEFSVMESYIYDKSVYGKTIVNKKYLLEEFPEKGDWT